MKKSLLTSANERKQLNIIIEKLEAAILSLDDTTHADLINELEKDYYELKSGGSRFELGMLQKELIIDQLNSHFSLPEEFNDLINMLNNYKQEDTSYKKYGLSGIIGSLLGMGR
ncbi:hypothetical protein [Pediococcus claussenii]|uniref:Bacteriocin immunity protein n=1 Tax=Pediococcus claussenii (strain ATCC BAA-344 / DSM 14800 / JCM 18046 / KCTC 3811 / LMG 21948 / P06) TaxID=701521 RepID=G8PB42_PEDCP|nr:hypothetical protein [Pediococcus claussenii]AEV94671.1 hypothetical protein PECL_362 [Pediococcus claussenii ATCC BAA-344]ANZ69867.1 hypothetical protein AYR57_05895 [Pediococcus claussenii]ANZ71684.1 hypothetical protein AYR58_05900 [Pediococcus claussenii]KRN20850.1 hypothetical protein IV79_GL000072 [Pediococcus claussenii]